MLPKIRCEICSGKLLGMPNSIFVCKTCGVEYSIEWARAKYCEAEGLVPLKPEPTPPDIFGVDESWLDDLMYRIIPDPHLNWLDDGSIDPPLEPLKTLPDETDRPDRETYWVGQYDSAPIEWMVLEKNENHALLISKHSLKLDCFDSKGHGSRWENCSLRQWLNETFYSEAFLSHEKERILTCDVSPCHSRLYKGTPGETVKDKLFLLSIPEAQRYFANDHDRICYLGVGVKSPDPNQPCYWWLRSLGVSEENPTMVTDTGEIYSMGSYAENDRYAVRPAMWIRLK